MSNYLFYDWDKDLPGESGNPVGHEPTVNITQSIGRNEQVIDLDGVKKKFKRTELYHMMRPTKGGVTYVQSYDRPESPIVNRN